MNTATANKLLKILEEPPDFTLFLLISENQEGLLPTILSRTQLIKVHRLKDDEVLNYLTTVLGANENNAQTIASVSQGNLYEAWRLHSETEDASGHLAMFRKWMQICFKNEINSMMDWVEEIGSMGREYQKNFLQYGLSIYRQCIMLHYTRGELNTVIGTEREFLQKFSPFVMGHNISQLNELFTKAIYHIERNGNGKLIFFNLSTRVMQLLRQQYKAA
jgi:DNA polymerase-3 subunit delta'